MILLMRGYRALTCSMVHSIAMFSSVYEIAVFCLSATCLS